MSGTLALVEKRPAFAPFGGRRGAMYLADLLQVVERARYRPDWRWHYRRRKREAMNLGLHECSGQVGNALKAAELNPWNDRAIRTYSGPVGNVKRGMIPEWDHHYEDIDKGIYCRGWKPLLFKWVEEGWLEPTKEICELLGPVISRSWKPKAVR